MDRYTYFTIIDAVFAVIFVAIICVVLVTCDKLPTLIEIETLEVPRA